MARPVQFSPDGEWFWDGTQWRSAYSPDRRWRWDGAAWRSVAVSAAAWRYEPTEWTRRLQVLVLALMAAGLLAVVILYPTFLQPLMQHSIDQSIAAQPANPDVDQGQLRSITTSILYGSLVVGGVVVVALYAVLIMGVVRLWRWVYWYLVVTYLIGLLGLPQDFVYALGAGPVRMPADALLVQVPLVLINGALGVWMIVLYRRYGTWARRRVPG